jgi:hypothetical protein
MYRSYFSLLKEVAGPKMRQAVKAVTRIKTRDKIPNIIRLLTFVGFFKGVHGYWMHSQNKKRVRLPKRKYTDGSFNEKTLPVWWQG